MILQAVLPSGLVQTQALLSTLVLVLGLVLKEVGFLRSCFFPPSYFTTILSQLIKLLQSRDCRRLCVGTRHCRVLADYFC